MKACVKNGIKLELRGRVVPEEYMMGTVEIRPRALGIFLETTETMGMIPE